jgi:glucose-6-phosphate isomerase
MENISVDISKALSFTGNIENLYIKAAEYNKALEEKTGKGNDFLGWVNLPSSISDNFISEINETVTKFVKDVEIVVCIGIGGSYLGAKAVIDALSNQFNLFTQKPKYPVIVFAGHQMCEDYITELRTVLSKKSWAIVVISKSGTTTEPAIAFRILKNDIENKFGKTEARKRIIAITDKSKGALRSLSNTEGYKTYEIPDDVGGRYSVLTPVGLIPIAMAGIDIKKLVEGAQTMELITKSNNPVQNNPSVSYAVIRNALYNCNKTTEILVNYHSKLHYIAEWWKQLYGESEGKEGKGIFPASVDFTSDLHSMGQYIQEGMRNIFETVISIKNSNNQIIIPNDSENLDQLNFLSGKRLGEVNKMAELGTRLAHVDGGVPNILIEVPFLNEYYLGQLIYFFEKACGISGYILGVNPFDQPGVENYKKNMFALLNKPGYEKLADELRKKI